MKNATLSITLTLLFLGVRAQDSSRYDIGNINLNKDFTPSITIRGEDLEKMPFVNLSDAISAWLYGVYTRPGMLAYVVDGDPVTDVNIYPIYDIEKVTLVEHAAGGAAYGGTQQQLVLITTRRGKGKGGMRAAAQIGAVNRNGDGTSTFTNFYHQYYIGAYRNLGKLSFGVSADWVMDVWPQSSGSTDQVVTPENLQRWRLNGYLRWMPARGNVIELGMGYATQQEAEVLDSSTPGPTEFELVRSFGHSHLLVPRLSWHLDLFPGLKNELHAQVLGSSGHSSYHQVDSTVTIPITVQTLADTNVSRVGQLMFRDRLSYDWRGGDWYIGPALDLSYQHIVERNAYALSSYAYSGYTTPPVLTDPPLGPIQEKTGDLLFMTPAVELGWRKMVDLQAGAQVNLSSTRDAAARTVLPFASIAAHLIKDTTGTWTIFGSYAQRALVFLDDYSMSDLSDGGAPYSLANVYLSKQIPVVTGSSGGTDTFLVHTVYPATFWTWDAGLSFASPNGRLHLQYTFEKRIFLAGGETELIGIGAGIITLDSWKSSLNHLDVRWKAVDTKDMRWLMDLNLTVLTNKEYDYYSPNFSWTGALFSTSSGPGTFGDVPGARTSWTGGVVNRWQLGRFTGGLDLSYHFGELIHLAGASFGQTTGPRLNTVLVPNIYAGYRWKLGVGMLELFLDSRGLLRTQRADQSDVLDSRRYYTIGGTYSL